MDEALELHNYLPISYKTPSEQDYIAFLWDAFETNYTHERYQFAFLAYHMLSMSFVYFNVWQIRAARPEDFEKGLIGFGKDIEKRLLEAKTPFGFSTIPERRILRFLRLIACDNGKIGVYSKLVDDRNDSAHPNGHIYLSSAKTLDLKIAKILRAVDEIQNHSMEVIQDCYRAFLLESHDPEEREYPDPADQVREILVHGNYLSRRDVEICLSTDLSAIIDQENRCGIDELHETLKQEFVDEDPFEGNPAANGCAEVDARTDTSETNAMEWTPED